MPIYTYECTSCDHRFEKITRMADRDLATLDPCPSCGAEGKVKKIIVTRFERMAPDQLGYVKPPEDWRNFLQDLKRRNPGSDFNSY
jgi:putative FmdB family regulatory protein